MLRLYLVRHAEPHIVNERKRGINVHGVTQTRQLAQTLRQEIPHKTTVTILYAPVERCRETAELLCDVLKCPSMQAPLRFSRAERLKLHSGQSKYSTYLANYFTLGMESPKEYTQRFVSMINKIESEYAIAVMSEVNIRVLLQILGNDEYNGPVRHATGYKIMFDQRMRTAAVEKIEQ